MPVAGPTAGQQIVDILEQREIAFHPGLRLSSVERQELVFEGERREPFDLLIAIPPHACPQVVQDAGLTEGSPWVRVDPHSLETRHEGVYALGDVTMVPLPNGMMLPKAGTFASGEAEMVAKNLAAQIKGEGARHQFQGHGT
jgi:sulfide:quinone oxidoreductase